MMPCGANIENNIRPPLSRISRREEVILARIRIGYSRLTHGYLLSENTVFLDAFKCTKYDALRTHLDLSHSYKELVSL